MAERAESHQKTVEQYNADQQKIKAYLSETRPQLGRRDSLSRYVHPSCAHSRLLAVFSFILFLSSLISIRFDLISGLSFFFLSHVLGWKAELDGHLAEVTGLTSKVS